MCRPAGARLVGDGIGYKYVAPLGLSDLAELNDMCERDSSGTTVAGKAREGDGADSPTP
jgi:hypothetical protein